MTNQTLSITDTLDDGYADPVWTTSAPNYYSSQVMSGWTFRLTAQIAAGSTISKCYFRVYKLTNQGGGAEQTRLRLENADPASNTRFSAGHLPALATFYTGAQTGTPTAYAVNNTYISGESDVQPQNLTADMQSLVTAYGQLEIGDVINVGHDDFAAAAGYLEVEDAATGTHPPQLFIEWSGGGSSIAAISSYHAMMRRNN